MAMLSVKFVLSAIEDFLCKSQKLGIIKGFSIVSTDSDIEENSESKELLCEFINKLKEEPMQIAVKLLQSVVQEVSGQIETESEISIKNDLIHAQIDANEMEIEAKLPQSEVQVISESTETESSIKNDLVQIQIDTNEMEIEAKLSQSETPEVFESEYSIKNDLVQIQIDTNEMKRRIAAFSTRKRQEVDEWNVQEFCGRSYIDEQDPAWEEQDSCARVDAVFIPRRGCKSHIKVSKVENSYGPQTMAKKIKTEFIDENESVTSQVMDERIKHMEQHLKLETDSSLRSSIFERLKNLEERILYLEGLSPEYIHIANSEYTSPKKKNFSEKEKLYSNWSIPDLNKRIKTLKEMLRRK